MAQVDSLRHGYGHTSAVVVRVLPGKKDKGSSYSHQVGETGHPGGSPWCSTKSGAKGCPLAFQACMRRKPSAKQPTFSFCMIQETKEITIICFSYAINITRLTVDDQ
ncbi:hypothetical protein MUK42_19500 [Musa troglodytarum]|uniref:Uncharacterized protein n=1 Tax=Musa troglodytarum TaxID=320322 RepID=A0A9E7H2Y7_9LILI|nr:hypothetical protein MUK42_19500 [Musa troglodytarum]